MKAVLDGNSLASRFVLPPDGVQESKQNSLSELRRDRNQVGEAGTSLANAVCCEIVLGKCTTIA
ncbi:MAG TPA: hypothetical protein VN739_04085 [Nitrososphaerales archaeon]|nr:hypothetical protein [Nitrososphaerales archaeon]